MDLPTHYVFGVLVGLVFFRNVEVALIIGLGALLPDLDREYWFVRTKKYVDQQKVYADEQVHRARLHNVFVMALTYPVSPFISLGVFLHVLQDSFTTAKDRGVEWFHPVTRLVKRGLKDAEGNPQPLVTGEQVYFYQQDPKGLINAADPDLRELGPDPVPWRRVYGFAQNGRLLDKCFLVGSAGALAVWIVSPLNFSNVAAVWSGLLSDYLILAYFGVELIYLAGETDRRDLPARFPELKPLQWPIFALGVGLLVVWGIFYSGTILQNLEGLATSPLDELVEGFVTVIAILGFISWRISTDKRNGKPTVV